MACASRRFGAPGERSSAANPSAPCLRKAPRPLAPFIAYVDPADERWRIDLLEADRPEDRPAERQKVLTAADIGGSERPVVYRQEGGWLMVVSYAPAARRAGRRARAMHATADVYNTGIVKSHTGLAFARRPLLHVGWRLSPPDPVGTPTAPASARSCPRPTGGRV